jgi:hypothetical protein
MGWVANDLPRRSYPWERPSTHCKGRLGGPTVGLNGCGKSRSPPGFDSRTVQPVASRYTDYVIPAHILRSVDLLCFLNRITDTIQVTEGRTVVSAALGRCFSTAGPRPGTGPWHQIYRAARICHFIFLIIFQ